MLTYNGAIGDPAKCPSSSAHHKLSKADAWRAKTPHAQTLTGDSHVAVANVINDRIDVASAPCDNFTSVEMDHIFRTLWCHRAPALNATYSAKDGRRLPHESLEGYEERWAREYKAAEPAASLRDGKCAHVLMMWTHHLSLSGRDEVVRSFPSFRLPQLPTYRPEMVRANTSYATSFSCVTGHNNTGRDSDHVWPHWPEEVHYTATGHGAYPFWSGPGGDGGSGHLEVWWSQSKASEKFYHEVCYMGEAGYSQTQAPCYHLFVGNAPTPLSYLYTATEDFCCTTQPATGIGEHLSAPQSDWMDSMTNQGEYVLTTPTEYNNCAQGDGCVLWNMQLPSSEPVTWFWYITTKEGKPVQQGEGGFSGAGIMIWHNYNTSSFEAVQHDASVFAVPEVCKTTTNHCSFP